MKKIKVAIIGCGRIGYKNDNNIKKGPYSHFKAVSQDKNFKLVGIAEKNNSLRKKIALKHNIKAYKDYKDLLNNHEIDLVIIATPDETHFEILKNIVINKPKYVLCEKPLTNNFYQTEKIIKLYKKNKIHLSVNFSRRYSKYFLKIKKCIDQNYFGKPLNVNLSYSRGFFHNAVHWLDLILWFFGMPKKVIIERNIKSSSYLGDRTIDLKIVYNSGLLIRLHGFDINLLGNEEFDLIGTKGRVKVNPDDKMTFYKIQNHKIYKKTKIFTSYRSYNMNNSDLLKSTLKNIKLVLGQKGVINISPAENNLQIFKLIRKSGLGRHISKR